MTPIPDFVEVQGPYLIPELEDGIHAITIYKYDRSRAGEANDAIGNGHMAFYGIPGYRYTLKLAAGAATARKMMGMEQKTKKARGSKYLPLALITVILLNS